MKWKSASTKYAHFTFQTQSVTTAEILVAKPMPKTLFTLRVSRVKRYCQHDIQLKTKHELISVHYIVLFVSLFHSVKFLYQPLKQSRLSKLSYTTASFCRYNSIQHCQVSWNTIKIQCVHHPRFRPYTGWEIVKLSYDNNVVICF